MTLKNSFELSFLVRIVALQNQNFDSFLLQARAAQAPDGNATLVGSFLKPLPGIAESLDCQKIRGSGVTDRGRPVQVIILFPVSQSTSGPCSSGTSRLSGFRPELTSGKSDSSPRSCQVRIYKIVNQMCQVRIGCGSK